MGTELSWGEKRSGGWGGGQVRCTPTQMDSVPPNWTPKDGYKGRFYVLYTFCSKTFRREDGGSPENDWDFRDGQLRCAVPPTPTGGRTAPRLHPTLATALRLAEIRAPPRTGCGFLLQLLFLARTAGIGSKV